LACVGGIVLVGVAKGLATVSESPAMDSVMGAFSSIAVTAFWVWIIVKLARSLGLNVWLYGVLGIVPLLNFLLLLQLSSRATATLRAAGIGVGFLGTSLPERPPTWFHAPAVPLGTGPETRSSFAPATKARPSRLAGWRKRFFRSFLASLLVGGAILGWLFTANPKDSVWANAVVIVGWLSLLVAGLSFVLYVVTGFLQLVIGAGKAVVETTTASLPGGGLKRK
jgi:hypothetical protein